MEVLESRARARLFYKYLSRAYDRVNPFTWNEEMRDEALEMFDIRWGDRVLGMGCGTGFRTEGLLRYTDDVHGLDQSIHQMQKVWERFGEHDEVRLYRGNTERLPFTENLPDITRSPGSIEHWPDPVTVLEEFRRVVKPGSKVLVIGPDDPKSGVFQKLADTIIPFYDEEGANQMFETTGFVDIEHHILRR